MAMEFRIQQMNNVMSNAGMKLAPSLFSKVCAYEKHVSALHIVVLFYAAIGTIVWSYGEPLYNSYSKLS